MASADQVGAVGLRGGADPIEVFEGKVGGFEFKIGGVSGDKDGVGSGVLARNVIGRPAANTQAVALAMGIEQCSFVGAERVTSSREYHRPRFRSEVLTEEFADADFANKTDALGIGLGGGGEVE